MAAPGAILALISYGVLELDPLLDGRFQRFYRDEIGPYWPAERKLVDSGYATIDFPFEEIAWPAMHIRVDWNLPGFLGYLTTWSAVRSAQEANREELLMAFANDIGHAWGDPNVKRSISWPINMHIGKVSRAAR